MTSMAEQVTKRFATWLADSGTGASARLRSFMAGEFRKNILTAAVRGLRSARGDRARMERASAAASLLEGSLR